ncbi:MAG: SEC-C domain-containing protein, partial [candidate division Zixibacteria bacterium]|nr:SEC-C domain-containing protein [candidate division Zixibacteria bacterium]
MDKMGVQEDEVITHPMVTKAIERAQIKIEAQNFAIRKHTLEYDDVMNVQRKWIYERRLAALERPSIKDEVEELIESVLAGMLDDYCPEGQHPEEWNMTGFTEDLRKIYLVNLSIKTEEIPELERQTFSERMLKAVTDIYQQKEDAYGEEVMRSLERFAVLSTIDRYWRDHLAEMEELRTGISLRSYHGGMGKPIDIYKREAFGIFETMIVTVDREIVNLVYKLRVNVPEKSRSDRRRAGVTMEASHADSTGMGFAVAQQAAAGSAPAAGVATQPNPMAEASQAGREARTFRREQPKVGRNDPCPCGSGKKFKKCHGMNG